MSFVWPGALGLLALGPLFVALYIRLVSRRAVRLAELASQGFVPNAATLRLRRLRHVPFGFFLAGLVLLLLALARPEMAMSVPHRAGHGDPRVRRIQ